MMIYAVGDIHGQLEMLQNALTLIDADGGRDAPVVFVGDLVDRGPASRQVIQTLIDGIDAGRDWTVLRGNHDQYFMDFLDRGEVQNPRVPDWMSWFHPRLGGSETLASYGVDAVLDDVEGTWHATLAAVPASHRAFLEALSCVYQVGELLFAHAGIMPGVPLEDQVEDDLVWIREPFTSFTDPHPWLVVHGHTPLEQPTHFGNRIDLDGGAGYGRPLIPAVLEGRDCWLLTGDGRIPLRP